LILLTFRGIQYPMNALLALVQAELAKRRQPINTLSARELSDDQLAAIATGTGNVLGPRALSADAITARGLSDEELARIAAAGIERSDAPQRVDHVRDDPVMAALAALLAAPPKVYTKPAAESETATDASKASTPVRCDRSQPATVLRLRLPPNHAPLPEPDPVWF
jgi:hypothetical protein